MSDKVELARRFNKHDNPKHAFAELFEDNLLENNPAEIGKFLYENRGMLKQAHVGSYIGSYENEKSMNEFVECFSFEYMNLVDALRTFLSSFRLPGEAQSIDRIMECFAKRYMNTAAVKEIYDFDSCYILCYSIIMLSTDIHNIFSSTQTKQHFKANLIGCNGEGNFDDEFIEGIYEKVLSVPLIPRHSRFGSIKYEECLYIKSFLRWKSVWYMMTTDNYLYYFKNQSEAKKDNAIGKIDINYISVETSNSGDKHIITILPQEGKQLELIKFTKSGNQTEILPQYTVAASTMDEMENWCEMLVGNYKTTSKSMTIKSARK